jgi:hypothetical protein
MVYALKMEEWTDAYKTSETIFTLINKQDKKIVKTYLQDFFSQLSQIFWRSDNLLFHGYALSNLHQIVSKSTTMPAAEKAQLSAELVFSALASSINNRLSNFERLSTNYLPKAVREDFQSSQNVTHEILKVSEMLQIKGMPSHESLITHIDRKNIHLVHGNPYISQLFKIIEQEDSPFTISSAGRVALEKAIECMPELEKYAAYIKKTLAIRMLQKSKNFFTNIRFASLTKMLHFYGEWDKIESLLYECNRMGHVQTITDHSSKVVTFD